MEKPILNNHYDLDLESKPKKSKQKRMWREIETIKDRYKLKQELAAIDPFNELCLDELNL